MTILSGGCSANCVNLPLREKRRAPRLGAQPLKAYITQLHVVRAGYPES